MANFTDKANVITPEEVHLEDTFRVVLDNGFQRVQIPIGPVIRKLSNDERLLKCQDCGEDASVIIVELETTKHYPHDPHYGRTWGWCGNCNIGG